MPDTPMRHVAIDLDVHRAIERARRTLAESDNDILRRLLLERRSERPRRRRGALAPVTRSRGQWAVEVLGSRQTATNMTEAYRLLLLKLEETAPGFLDRFAREGTHSRTFVAREPQALFKNSPHLARQFGRHLDDDWYYDANLSADQVARRARVAARLAGLAYGRDVRLLDNLREI